MTNCKQPLVQNFVHIAIHRKFQTRRVAEDSTRLYGEATQHRMRLSVDGYIAIRRKKARIPAGFLVRMARQNSSVTQPFEAELTVRAYL